MLHVKCFLYTKAQFITKLKKLFNLNSMILEFKTNSNDVTATFSQHFSVLIIDCQTVGMEVFELIHFERTLWNYDEGGQMERAQVMVEEVTLETLVHVFQRTGFECCPC